MSGHVTAAGGQIATFSISSGSIDSDTSNSKRGLKLEPGKSIRGYGNTAHSTTTLEGKFSFTAGFVANDSVRRDISVNPTNTVGSAVTTTLSLD